MADIWGKAPAGFDTNESIGQSPEERFKAALRAHAALLAARPALEKRHSEAEAKRHPAEKSLAAAEGALMSFAQARGLDLDYLQSPDADLDGVARSNAVRGYGPLKDRPLELFFNTSKSNVNVSRFATPSPDSPYIEEAQDFSNRTMKDHLAALEALMNTDLPAPSRTALSEYRDVRDESDSRLATRFGAQSEGAAFPNVDYRAPADLGVFEAIFEKVAQHGRAQMEESHADLQKAQSGAGARGATDEQTKAANQAVDNRIRAERDAFEYMTERELHRLEAPLAEKYDFRGHPMPPMPKALRAGFIEELHRIPTHEAVINPALGVAEHKELLQLLGQHERATTRYEAANSEAIKAKEAFDGDEKRVPFEKRVQFAADKVARAEKRLRRDHTGPQIDGLRNEVLGKADGQDHTGSATQDGAPAEAGGPATPAAATVAAAAVAEPLSAAAAWAAEPVEPGEGEALRERGQMVAKGAAPYLHKPDEDMSYFVEMDDAQRLRSTHWGTGLEPAVADVAPGDWFELTRAEKQPGATGVKFGGARRWGAEKFVEPVQAVAAAPEASSVVGEQAAKASAGRDAAERAEWHALEAEDQRAAFEAALERGDYPIDDDFDPYEHDDDFAAPEQDEELAEAESNESTGDRITAPTELAAEGLDQGLAGFAQRRAAMRAEKDAAAAQSGSGDAGGDQAGRGAASAPAAPGAAPWGVGPVQPADPHSVEHHAPAPAPIAPKQEAVESAPAEPTVRDALDPDEMDEFEAAMKRGDSPVGDEGFAHPVTDDREDDLTEAEFNESMRDRFAAAPIEPTSTLSDQAQASRSGWGRSPTSAVAAPTPAPAPKTAMPWGATPQSFNTGKQDWTGETLTVGAMLGREPTAAAAPAQQATARANPLPQAEPVVRRAFVPAKPFNLADFAPMGGDATGASPDQAVVSLATQRGVDPGAKAVEIAQGIAKLQDDPAASPASREQARLAAQLLNPRGPAIAQVKQADGTMKDVRLDRGAEGLGDTQKSIDQHVAGFEPKAGSDTPDNRPLLTKAEIDRLAADHPLLERTINEPGVDRWRAAQPGATQADVAQASAAHAVSSNGRASAKVFADKTEAEQANDLLKMAGLGDRLRQIRERQAQQTAHAAPAAGPSTRGI